VSSSTSSCTVPRRGREGPRGRVLRATFRRVILSRSGSTVFVPDALSPAEGLARTTHLGVAAHADDLEIMAIHGILACFEQAERWFAGVIATDGVGSPQRGAPIAPEELRAVRRREQERAAVLGHYGAVVFLDHSSGGVKDATERGVVDDLVAVLRATRPGIVYTHALSDAHDTHVAVTLRLLEACRALAPDERPEKVLGCEVWRSLDWLTVGDKVELAVDERPELQAALLDVFESQLREKRYDRAALGRRAANAAFAESHRTDRHEAVVYAMDLTPLVGEVAQPVDLMQSFMRRLEADVVGRIHRLSG
jgi:LmbE family N-acetylglucosaminyl deacetylase